MKFEDRAVAFVDILGFSNLVSAAASDHDRFVQLENLVGLLSAAVPELNSTVSESVPRCLVPKHIYISDCIILSAPLRPTERSGCDGLTSIVMRVIQLSHYFLRAGYLIRGGISTGKTWHSDVNIIGPAYQEAVAIEKAGNEPTVVLSSSAKDCWNYGSGMCLQRDGKMFVNGLFDYYIPNSDQPGVIEQTFVNYAELAKQRLEGALPEPAKEKWRWFYNFLRKEAPVGLDLR